MPEARQIALLCGVDLSEHRSQRLSALSLEAADLVIGFEEEHVRRAVVDAGAARAKSFLFREFVRLAGQSAPAASGTTVERARATVTLADDLRRRDPSAAGEPIGVPDPFGRPWKEQRVIAVLTRQLSLELAEHVFAVDGSEVLLPIPKRIRRGLQWRRHRH